MDERKQTKKLRPNNGKPLFGRVFVVPTCVDYGIEVKGLLRLAREGQGVVGAGKGKKTPLSRVWSKGGGRCVVVVAVVVPSK
jgi:hypothetical protein